MTFARSVFAFALLMLVVGIVGSRYIFTAIFGQLREPATTPIAALTHRSTPQPTIPNTATPTARPPMRASSPTPRPTATLPPTPTVRPPATRALKRIKQRRPHPQARKMRRVKATPRPTTTPLPTPTTGTVALARYWVGSVQARSGQTVSVGYVIDNQTGRTARVVLGASIKGSRVLGWASGSLSDPYHDVVAIVPPGISTHVRYFTLPPSLHPGVYDIAWGLRSAGTGLRDALATAPGVLRVMR